MARELFPMYCGLNGISGMDEEKDECEGLLELAKGGEKLIVLIPLNSNVEWIYGQCNFHHDPDHLFDFKFSNTCVALRGQNVIPALIAKHGVDAVLFKSKEQFDWFMGESSMRKYRSYFSLLKASPKGLVRP